MEQGGVFRQLYLKCFIRRPCFNPFGTGQGLSTDGVVEEIAETIVSIPLEQGVVFRQKLTTGKTAELRFNPFGAGRGLSTANNSFSVKECTRFNPFEAGRGLLTLASAPSTKRGISLNPFGTGQGLSTYSLATTPASTNVSIPLEQGGVFRRSSRL